MSAKTIEYGYVIRNIRHIFTIEFLTCSKNIKCSHKNWYSRNQATRIHKLAVY
ncbi:hypothetical protein Hanom_Chr06g00503321 [Helianthus anomalus]